MYEVKLAPNLPGWTQDHAKRYLASGGRDGHMVTITPPGYSEMTLRSLLLTTTGRTSGEKYVFPLFYGQDWRQLLRGRLERRRAGAPGLVSQPSGQPGGRGAGGHETGEGESQDCNRRGAHTVVAGGT